MMEKRFFLAFILTFLILVVYQQFFLPKKPATPSKQQQVQEIAEVKPAEEKASQLIPQQEDDLPRATIGNFDITYSPTGGYIKSMVLKDYGDELYFQNIGFDSQTKDKKYRVEVSQDRITFTRGGKKKEFIFEGYKITLKTDQPSPTPILLFSNSLSSNMLDKRYQELFYSQNSNLQRKGFSKIKAQNMENIEYAGARDRYFCISLLKGNYSIEWSRDKKNVFLSIVPSSSEISFYIGPQKIEQLKAVGLEKIIYYGFFHGLAIMMGKLLGFIFSIVKNWGASIIILALLVYLVLSPFTMKSTRAMKRMQEIQPHIEELKQKYKDNPQRLQKEIMQLYKEYKINPLGGCLPMFFQLPIIFALYQVFLRSFELKGAHFLWIQDLSAPDRAFKLPFPPPADYLNILPIIIVILGLIQQKFMTASSTGSSEQKSMGLFFSVFMGVIFYKFPSCLVLYWLMQTSLTLIYQIRISRT